MKLREEILNVAESPMVQIATIAESMPGSLKLCYGESDMPTPAFICRAADEAMRAGHTFYTHTAGYRELREAIASKITELHQVRYDVPEIMATVGGTMAIYAAIRALVGRGDNAVIVSPAYAIFSNAVIMSGGEPRPAPLARRGDRFVLDLDRVREAIDADTRLIVVNSPSNPTGWVITEDEQRALAEIAERHDVVILADEVYERLVYDGRAIAPSFARVVTNRDRLIVINSFSKTYNMTGWRLGWAQTSARTITAMYKAAEFMTSNPAAMVQQAGIAALRDGEPYVAELREHYRQRRDQVTATLSNLPGVSLPDPQGAFYAFPKFDDSTDSAAFTAALLRDTGLALAPGVGFGRDGEGYIRVCFASTEATISDALARLKKYVVSRRS
ncbi:MAG TPA: aminotransferase class I/II-fold pyridoxal phosphate-dependent enzyme [Vicinamibacterales bacterium]|nr:aminotransferase class I/II-fold pyridoxal phosphate-dependent enzyme [Vicinamibacterales bacterium]